MNTYNLKDFQATLYTSPKGEELVILPYEKLLSLIDALSEPQQEIELSAILALLSEIDLAHENLIFSFDNEAGFHRLKAVRKARGLNQHQLAKLANLSQPLISSLENNTNEGTVESWIKLANSLDVSLDYLLK